MKIEIWCEGINIYGKDGTDLVIARVPPDIKMVDSNACKEILIRRRKRIEKINNYRNEFNNKFKNVIERDLFGKKLLKEKLYTTHIKGWSPIISREALEFISSNF